MPGPKGNAGSNGTDGSDGIDAFTVLDDNFTMPAELATATAVVADARWMVAGQMVFMRGCGYLTVTTVTDSTHVVLLNPENTATGAYTTNVPAGTVIPLGATISPAGVQGAAGTDGTSGAPDDAGYVTIQAEAGLSGEFNLGALTTGLLKHVVAAGVSTPATAADGTDYLSPTTGCAKADNLAGLADAAISRTNLGLGTVAVKDYGVADGNAVVVDDAAFTSGQPLLATVNGIESVTPAAFAAATGIGSGSYALYQYKVASGTGSGTWTQGAFQTAPLNTEVVDTGGIISVAANQLTIPTGVYRIHAIVPGYMVDEFITRLYNITDGTVEFYGTTAKAASTDATTACSHLLGRLTVAGGPKVYEVQGRCTLTNGTSGWGAPTSMGVDEVYVTIELTKEV